MRGDDGEVVPVPVELARLGPERRLREYLLRGRAGEHRGDDAADVFVSILRRGRQSRKWGRFVHHPLGSRRLVGQAQRGELRAGGFGGLIGVGGSIPFITLFADQFPDTPLILNGVMDPQTGAHGPNESMHVGLFAKVVAANVLLLDELAATLGGAA